MFPKTFHVLKLLFCSWLQAINSHSVFSLFGLNIFIHLSNTFYRVAIRFLFEDFGLFITFCSIYKTTGPNSKQFLKDMVTSTLIKPNSFIKCKSVNILSIGWKIMFSKTFHGLKLLFSCSWLINCRGFEQAINPYSVFSLFGLTYVVSELNIL